VVSDPLIRNVNDVEMEETSMEGASGLKMSVMVGQSDGAPNFSMRQIHVDSGGHSPRHSHDYEHEVYVLGGAGSVLLHGEKRPIRAGDVIYVPADEEHQFEASDSDPAGLRFLCLVPASRNCGEATPGS
jgi:quercetin dioxygenase-like cupin family protein